MLRLRGDAPKWVPYELDGEPSEMPAPVAEEIVQRTEASGDGASIVSGSMRFRASDFEEVTE